MDELITIDFDNLTDEEIIDLRSKYIHIFEELKKHIDAIEIERKNALNESKKIDSLKVSKYGKLVLIAKRIIFNAIASQTLGIDPYLLDNDFEFLRLSDVQKKQYYKKCDPSILAYKVTVDMQKGLEDLLKNLNSYDIEQTREFLKRMDIRHAATYKVANDEAPSYEPPLYPILYHEKIINNDVFNKYAVFFERGWRIGLNYNFVKEIDNIYKEYENKQSMNKSK